MSAATFEEAIAAAIPEFDPNVYPDGRHDMAGAILITDEMKAIGHVLHRLGVYAAAGVDTRWRLLWNSLPMNVKQWAAEDQL